LTVRCAMRLPGSYSVTSSMNSARRPANFMTIRPRRPTSIGAAGSAAVETSQCDSTTDAIHAASFDRTLQEREYVLGRAMDEDAFLDLMRASPSGAS
jgi:hypothetical protein